MFKEILKCIRYLEYIYIYGLFQCGVIFNNKMTQTPTIIPQSLMECSYCHVRQHMCSIKHIIHIYIYKYIYLYRHLMQTGYGSGQWRVSTRFWGLRSATDIHLMKQLTNNLYLTASESRHVLASPSCNVWSSISPSCKRMIGSQFICLLSVSLCRRLLSANRWSIYV